jgi:hypothetical protein
MNNLVIVLALLQRQITDFHVLKKRLHSGCLAPDSLHYILSIRLRDKNKMASRLVPITEASKF